MRDRDSPLPEICYTDPAGVIRGPFEEWRILDWYRQGFFTKSILFKLEKEEAQFSLGELVERFGQDNPFASRENWSTTSPINCEMNGSNSSVTDVQTERNNACCTQCQSNGEKLDALMIAVQRLQSSIDVQSHNIACNTTAIGGLRALLEESRISAWKWNASEIPSENDPYSAETSPFNCSQTNGGVDPKRNGSISGKQIALEPETASPSTTMQTIEDATNKAWPVPAVMEKSFSSDAIGMAHPEHSTENKSAQLDSLVSSELQKLRVSPQDSRQAHEDRCKSSSLLERIRKRGTVSEAMNDRSVPSTQQRGGVQQSNLHHSDVGAQGKPSPPSCYGRERRSLQHDSSENDWVNACTRPSFHPFPSATTHSQPMHGPGPIWPGLGSPNTGHSSSPWAHNHFSPLQMQLRNPPSPPCNTMPSFAAAALKKEKEIHIRPNKEVDEGGPHLVPVGRPARLVMRRAPQHNNK